MPAYTDGVNLHIKVIPNASQSKLVGFEDGVLQIKIAAPPVKGKANRELVAFLSRLLEVKKSSVLIIKGQTSRNKIITIEGLNHEDIIKRLSL